MSKSAKLALLAVLIVCSLLLKENDMPVNQVLKEGQGNKAKSQPTQKTPAWLSSGGAGAGGGYRTPGPMIPMTDEEIATGIKNQVMSYQGFQTPTSSTPVGAVNKPGDTPFSNIPGASVGTLQKIKPKPAYGGSYNPTSTNPAYNAPAWMTPVNAPDPATMVNNYVGNPVDTSMSDTLRSMTPPPEPVGFQTPFTIGFMASNPFRPKPKASYPGFGSTYGGNWGGGGGGGGGGNWGGGGGYDDRAAWINYLQGLYSWNIK